MTRVKSAKRGSLRKLIVTVVLTSLGALITGACATNADDSAAPVAQQQRLSVNQAAGNRYIVSFINPAKGDGTLKAAGAKKVLDLPSIGAAAAYVPANAVAALSNNPNVADIELDPKRYPSAQETPYGIPMVQADLLGDPNAADVTVCIIDSGIYGGHEDLPSTVTASADSGTGDPLDDNCGHGSHVAGTIAAVNNSLGVVGVSGGGALNLHIVKVFGNDCGWAYSSSLIAALDKCQTESPTPDHVVVNMSLGGTFKSRSEERAFDSAYATGKVLPVAAAGNDGNTRKSYPASYDSVISVAAVDDSKTVASFSQQNSEVELAAPGVAVLSTMKPGAVDYSPASTLDVGSLSVDTNALAGSPNGAVTAPLAGCGKALSTCSGVSGAICLIERGDETFANKVLNCQHGGGVGAIIYNNESGPLLGTLDTTVTSIPSVGISQADGNTLLNGLGNSATLVVDDTSPYTKISGTSMATPHVAGAAAVLWSHFTGLANADVRDALGSTAEDLGSTGRDPAYGYGLVQLFDAFTSLAPAAPCSDDSECDDSDACNGAETCVNGSCMPGNAPNCNDSNPCTADSCDAAAGCQNDPLAAGTSCADGNVCNGDETCDGAGSCSAAPAPAGTDCGDADACNGEETCDGSGNCAPGTNLECGTQVCDPSQGCVDPPSCKGSGERCKGNGECCSNACYVGGGPPRCG